MKHAASHELVDGQVRKCTIMVACMLFIPILVQAPSVWFAYQLRWYVIVLVIL